MRRSTPSAGLGAQFSFAAWTMTGFDRSSLMRMAWLLRGRDHPELDVAGLRHLVDFERLLQRRGLDLRGRTAPVAVTRPDRSAPRGPLPGTASGQRRHHR